MKIIKYNWSNWYKDFNPSDLDYFLVNLFKEDLDIELVLSKDNPDYVFYGPYGDYLTAASLAPFNTIKVFYAVEPISPDFQFFDYCVGFEPYSFGNRYLYFPFFMCFLKEHYEPITRAQAVSILNEKTAFCDFIFTHDGVEKSRKKYFELLSSYKRVEGAGTYLNNQNNKNAISYMDSTKVNFQSKCKFSLCIQSTDIDWFFNEEIVDAFNANSIPIFYGSKSIKKIFNPRRFIYVGDYKTDDELLEAIKRIDLNDELYLNMLMEPIYVNPNFYDDLIINAKTFFKEIFFSENPKVLRERFVVRRNIVRIKENYRRLEIINKISNFLHPFRKRQ